MRIRYFSSIITFFDDKSSKKRHENVPWEYVTEEIGCLIKRLSFYMKCFLSEWRKRYYTPYIFYVLSKNFKL